MRPWQWLGAASVVLVLALRLRERGLRLRSALPWLALAALLVPTYVEHFRLLSSDGLHYYAWLHSALFDFDLDLANQYAVLWPAYTAPNVLPIGAPLLWSPFVGLVHLAGLAARSLGVPEATGYGAPYTATAAFATLVYAGAGLFLLMDTLRRFFSPAAAFWTTVLVWVGSPLRFYLSVLPCFAHGAEFFASVLVLRAWLALRARPDATRAALAGAACGLVFLTRSQDGLLLLLPGIELGLRLVSGSPSRRSVIRAGLLALAAFLAVASPQLALWQAQFGQPFVVPHQALHGEAFLTPTPMLAETLVSPRGGLFAAYPLMALAFLGLGLLVLRPRAPRPDTTPIAGVVGRTGARLDARYVATLAPVLVLGWYVNASVFDWWQVRRFTGVVPLVAPGLAVVAAPLAAAGPVVPAVLAFLTWRYDLAIDHLRPTPGAPVPVRAALVDLADGLAADAYRLVEPRVPALAPQLLGAYTGEPLLEGAMSRIVLAAESSLLRLPEPARHLSAPEVEDGRACRWIEDRDARLFLPLSWDGGVIVTLTARALETEEPQTLSLAWNGAAVGSEAMAAEWRDYRFHVPAAAVRAGTNELVLAFDRTPIYRRARGVGPRRVRPACVSQLVLHRGAAR